MSSRQPNSRHATGKTPGLHAKSLRKTTQNPHRYSLPLNLLVSTSRAAYPQPASCQASFIPTRPLLVLVSPLRSRLSSMNGGCAKTLGAPPHLPLLPGLMRRRTGRSCPADRGHAGSCGHRAVQRPEDRRRRQAPPLPPGCTLAPPSAGGPAGGQCGPGVG
jgi:hypothetical protein